jgi:hypothetical protein
VEHSNTPSNVFSKGEDKTSEANSRGEAKRENEGNKEFERREK